MDLKELDDLERRTVARFNELGAILKNENRFFLPEKLKIMVEEYVQFNMDEKRIDIRAGEIYYRARINGIGQEKPYDLDKMKAPPLGEARAGRINPDGISYLYLADDIDTAIAEVRPHQGARVTVATVEIEKDLNIVFLNKGARHNSINYLEPGHKVNLNSLYISDIYFSTPVHADDKFAYLASQYIAELFKFKGIDGIQFGSTQTKTGMNLAIFNQDHAKCTNVSQYEIKQVNYTKKLSEIV